MEHIQLLDEGGNINMNRIITLDMLTKNSVSILIRNFNDNDEQIGEDWRRAFINTKEDKEAIKSFLGENSKEYNTAMQI